MEIDSVYSVVDMCGTHYVQLSLCPDGELLYLIDTTICRKFFKPLHCDNK